MPAEFHFLRPEWLIALPFVIAGTIALARRRLSAGSWQRVVDPALAPHVLSTSQNRQGSLRWWLAGLGGVLAVTALAGPAWNRVEQPVFRSEQALVVALDLSRSMDAQDLSPNRVTRAKLKILDILERRKSGQTALVVYSANAFTVTPLTTDTDTVAALVNSLATDIMPSRGSYPAAAIEKAHALLEQAGVADGEVLLITDGGVSTAAEQAAQALLDAGYRLNVLAVGTPDGAPIPRPDGGFVTDRFGQMAVPRLETDTLERLADAGGGVLAVITTGDDDLERLLSDAPGRGAESDDALATDQWREEGPWLLLALVPLAALAFRRGWVIAIAFLALPLPRPAEAFEWQDLWRSNDQQARELLAEGEPGRAAELFDDPDWRAVAQYRAGRYDESANAFASGRADADRLYNLGNSLARLGQYEAAIETYDQALELAPDDEDAAYNRDLIKQFLEAQDSQSQQNRDSGGESGGQAQQSEGQSQGEESGEQANQGSPGSESQDGESSREQEAMSEDDMQALKEELERAAQEAAERGEQNEPQEGEGQNALSAMQQRQEQQQAMEQWLRRIPNDPGGLLRRKFRYQYQRQGRDQDGNNLWPDDEVQPW